MPREMLINVAESEECRVAVVEKGCLEELYVERASLGTHVGNIYKGKVVNIESGIQAAFIDFGVGKNGFLHISDLHPRYFSRTGAKSIETIGRRKSLKDRPPIQDCLRKGKEIVVQVTKEGIKTKGATLSTYVALPGRTRSRTRKSAEDCARFSKKAIRQRGEDSSSGRPAREPPKKTYRPT